MKNRWVSVAVGLAILAVGLICGGGIGYIAGGVYAEQSGYRRIFFSQQKKIEPVIASSRDFSKVIVNMESQGDAYLVGSVPTESARELLRQEMQRLFGEDRAKVLIGCVTVAGK